MEIESKQGKKLSIGLLCWIVLAITSFAACTVCIVLVKNHETKIGIFLSSVGIVISLFGILWSQLPELFNRSVKKQISFKIESSVAKEGVFKYGDQLIVKPGDIVDFHLYYKNTGNVTQKNVTGYDDLPEGFRYISGSSFLRSSTNQEGNIVSDDLFSEKGINLGNFRQGEWCELTYRVNVEDSRAYFSKGDNGVFNDVRISTSDRTGCARVEVTVRRD